MRKICFALLFMGVFLYGLLSAQVLPKGMTAEEKVYLSEYLSNLSIEDRTEATPPQNPRSPAEWEEMQGVAITWTPFFRAILAQIVEHAQNDVTVYIHIEEEDIPAAQNYLAGQGIDLSQNVEFIIAPNNSIWIRDYGANAVYVNGVDSLVFIDWLYNRPRFQDDNIPARTGAHMGIPVISLTTAPTDLVHTGGNFMSDGLGHGFSSRLVLEENGANNDYGMSNHSVDDVDLLMHNFMGIEDYLLMTALPFDVINHIDMHMKIVNEETIIMGQYPEGVADGPQIEANLNYLIDEIQSTYERPYKIVRMPMPPDDEGLYPDDSGDYRTYTNAIILNSTVLVPTYEEQYDTTALRIWRETLPGHTITGIDCNAIIPLSGALHCITKEIGAPDPIQIIHTPALSLIAEEDHMMDVTVHHRHPVDEVWLLYSQDGILYDSLQMVSSGDQWSVTLSDLIAGELFYYFRAHSALGKIIDKPLMGSRGGVYRVEVNTLVNQHDLQAEEVFVIHQSFPNPASAMVMTPIDVVQRKYLKAELLDASGRLIETVFDGYYEPFRRGIYFDASVLATGSYLLSIQIDGESPVNRTIQVVR